MLRGHISVMIHQLRLRVAQIEMEGKHIPEEDQLCTLLQDHYYFQKILPLVIADGVRQIYLMERKRILQNGVMTEVNEVMNGFFFLCSVLLMCY